MLLALLAPRWRIATRGGGRVLGVPLSESDTRSKLIDPKLYQRGWTEDHIRREETAPAIDVVNGKARRRGRGRVDYTLRVRVWYYDLSGVKVGKKTPLTRQHFDGFFALLPTRGDGERSWTVTREQIEA